MLWKRTSGDPAQRLIYEQLYTSYNMAETRDVHIVGRVKKVGNSLAVFIPAEDARRAGLTEGQTVEADIRPSSGKLLGLLKGVPYQPFSRRDLYDE